MAGKSSNMLSFVHGRNGDPAVATPDITDLKVKPPKKDKKSKHSSRTTGEGRQPRNQGHRGFIGDTDGSEADKTSTVLGNERHQYQAAQQQPPAQQPHRPIGDAMYGNTDAQAQSVDEGEQDEFGDLTADPADMAAFYEQTSREAWLNELRVKGDSYPPTTSGRLSVTESHGQETVAAQPTPKATEPRERKQPRAMEPPGTRLPFKPGRHQQLLPSDKAESPRPQRQATVAPQVLDENGEPDFSFTAREARNPDMRRTGNTAHPQGLYVKQEVIETQPSVGRPAAKKPKALPQHTSRPPATANRAEQSHGHQHLPARGMQFLQAPPVQTQLVSPDPTGPESEGQPDEMSDAYDQDDPAAVGQQQIYDPYAQFDYPPNEIYNKSLDSLAAEKFDTDPKASPFVVEGLTDTSSLAEKVANATALEPKHQTAFFASLDIDEWEEAGDWFLDRFADIVKKLKTTRHEKRQAAKMFEQEIKERNLAIAKKRSVTDEVLGGMKRQGDAVLQATPKKQRSSK